jgi:hypothetical protein
MAVESRNDAADHSEATAGAPAGYATVDADQLVAEKLAVEKLAAEAVVHPTGETPDTTDKYVGETQYGRFHGRGTLTRADGSVWQGSWRNGKPHGDGFLQIIPNVFRFEGGMSAGKRHGRGKETRADGRVVEGTWRMGKRVAATSADADGSVLEYGTRSLPDGSTVEGAWRDGKWQGRCTRVLLGKYRFECEFRDCQAEGRGVLVYSSGTRMEGEWRGGEFCRGEIVEHPGGNVYRGEIARGLRNGAGEMVRPQRKLTLRGTWQEGSLYGLVQEECADLYSFSGAYQRGFRHGQGMLTSARTKWMLWGVWTHGVLKGSVVIMRAGAEHAASLQAEYDAARGGLGRVRVGGVDVAFDDIFPAAWIDTRAATLFDDTVECINRLLRVGNTMPEVAALLAVSETELVDWFAAGVGTAVGARDPAHAGLTDKMRTRLKAASARQRVPAAAAAGGDSRKRCLAVDDAGGVPAKRACAV